jgi:hypothetical protein
MSYFIARDGYIFLECNNMSPIIGYSVGREVFHTALESSPDAIASPMYSDIEHAIHHCAWQNDKAAAMKLGGITYVVNKRMVPEDSKEIRDTLASCVI